MPKIEEAIQYSTKNDKEIRKSKLVGCYYCLKIYPASEISDKDFLAEERTAVCSYCQTDSVLPDTSGFKMDESTLQEIHKVWF